MALNDYQARAPPAQIARESVLELKCGEVLRFDEGKGPPMYFMVYSVDRKAGQVKGMYFARFDVTDEVPVDELATATDIAKWSRANEYAFDGGDSRPSR